MTLHSPNESRTQQETGRSGPGLLPKSPMAMCPMAATCKGMTAKPMPKFLLPVPGPLFIAVGVLILLIPAFVVWFIAFASIAMGVMMLIFASFMTKMGERFQRMHS